jgi:hypothetical protein
MQGSVKLNGQIWNYYKDKQKWEQNTWGSGCNPPFASATQCVVPFQDRSSQKPVTGAVLKNGQLPMGRSALIYLQVPNAWFDPFKQGLLVNTHDECPGCDPLQVDILSAQGEFLPTFNTRGGRSAKVYIWAALPR